jgi:uncharacterized protein YggL (DUF469 family)
VPDDRITETRDEAIDRIVQEMSDVNALAFEGTVRGALAEAWQLGERAVGDRMPQFPDEVWPEGSAGPIGY